MLLRGPCAGATPVQALYLDTKRRTKKEQDPLQIQDPDFHLKHLSGEGKDKNKEVDSLTSTISAGPPPLSPGTRLGPDLY